jgi:hydrogenase maturation protease
MQKKRVLIIGYGNPGRGDDGIGPALAQRLESLQLAGVTTESDYQLTIEHAAMVAEHDVVVFADAALDAESAYYFRQISAGPSQKYSSHSVTPSEVLLLAGSCFNAAPQAYVLGIRAHNLEEFGEGLSSEAQEALEAALQFLLNFIREQQSAP